MRIIELFDGPGHPIDRFESVGASHLGGVRFTGGGAWAFLDIGAGGHLGRHPALLDQLLAVIEGSGWLAGADRIRAPIRTGHAALWTAGEEHESGSEAGMRVAVLEAATIEVPG